MLMIGYKKCSTCAKAEVFLRENGLEYTYRDIKSEPPTQQELTQWLQSSGLPVKRLFNTSGMLYKEKNLKQRLPEMTLEEQLELLASDGMLVKRPILVTDSEVLFGFKQDQWWAAAGMPEDA